MLSSSISPCSRALVWFRRDLRDYDHAALYYALRYAKAVYCVFVFDTEILDGLPPADRRVEFIHGAVLALDAALQARGGGLIVRHGKASEIIPALAAELQVQAVFLNRDYEPQAIIRETKVKNALQSMNIMLSAHKDQVIFEQNEILTQAKQPYSVFTPYKNAWLKRLNAEGGDFYVRSYPITRYASALIPPPAHLRHIPSLAELGFAPSNLCDLGITPGLDGAAARWADFQPRISNYQRSRDFPALKGVSYLSLDLRFGTLSIRELVRTAWQTPGEGAATWLNELIWRDFYFMILHHFPHVVTGNFRPSFNAVQWADWAEGLAAWQNGQTGYPLVDAAMRQLLHSGYMHNRLRMLTASFLTKDLGIDWREGERFFALHLNDYDLAANNGGWQWAASTGCDAQPWFRIFNPVTQSEKFDPDGKFIRRYVPELAKLPNKHIHAPWLLSSKELASYGITLGQTYPAPIVDHTVAREKTLARFAVVKGEGAK